MSELVLQQREPDLPLPTRNENRARSETEERRLHGGVTLEEATRVRAYQLWERAGRPEGDSVSFWLEAEAELLGGA